MKVKQKLIGVDEAGRGAWAGPLVAAAVALDKEIPGLNDSKRLTPKRRESFYEMILGDTQVGVGIVEPGDIDKHGLTWAQTAAMQRAVDNLGQIDAQIIVDGSVDYLNLPNSRAVVRADSWVTSVMAASIIAKVTRDKIMAGYEAEYPGYGFSAHKGYGTAIHMRALKDLGICQLHRRSYKPVAALL
ncbi:MAG TPA: ribonuclease HII [Candidatus Saccharimonadales bacterium]